MIIIIDCGFIVRFTPSRHTYLRNMLYAAVFGLLLTQLISLCALVSVTQNHVSGAPLIVDLTENTHHRQINRSGEQTEWLQKMGQENSSMLLVINTNREVINKLSSPMQFSVKLSEGISNAFAIIVITCATFIFAFSKQSRVGATLFFVIGVCHFYIGIANNFNVNATQSFSTLSQASYLIASCICFFFAHQNIFNSTSTSKVLLTYASQSGSAMQLAKKLYRTAERHLDIYCISKISPDMFSQYDSVLVIASTYGDGDAPDKAQNFVRRLNNTNRLTQAPEFSILALGDKNYQKFCAFGHELHALLHRLGGRPISEPTEVDKLDAHTIENWWRSISSRYDWEDSVSTDTPTETFVITNTCLNPAQKNRYAHSIELENTLGHFQAGDLLEVFAKQNKTNCLRRLDKLGLAPTTHVTFNKKNIPLIDAVCESEWRGESADSAQDLVDQLRPLAPRTYSIANIEQENKIRLLVREHIREDGSKGIASHYLCHRDPGDRVFASLKTHPNFHLPQKDVPVIMIAAGTGIAPFIGFLKQKKQQKRQAPFWLFFGEQHHEHDYYFKEEISKLEDMGILNRLDLAWSRDLSGTYIHEKIKLHKTEITNSVQCSNATIYVCGSLRGFGESTLQTLKSILGNDRLESLIQQGRLKTDLY